MGIPAYFRWISEKFPRIMVDCVEHVRTDPDTMQELPIDASAPNPNQIEFDNLYLDMNGIIHPCTHPEDRPAPTTEQEMFEAIFDYIDRIFSIIRPRAVVYMAIDGVAPRAKINQQRSRRFRSAQETEEKRRTSIELREEWQKLGLKVSDNSEEEPADVFDSNVITPGTPFMSRLAVALRGYVATRVAHTPAWKAIKVIFSDASVPGEGEHKIAEYIRRQRTQPAYNPNIRHVMYGLDADLIMLALATHEVRFTVLREEVFAKRGGNRNDGNHAPNHPSKQPPTQVDSVLAHTADDSITTRAQLGGRKPFHFLHINVLREYLDYEFKTDIERELAAAPASEIAYDLERVIDDFVFMCFFVGNDFLPHLPTLDIREGAIDYLIELYKTELPRTGYLTSSQGDVDFARVRQLLLCVGRKEDQVFQERAKREKDSLERAAREKSFKLEQEKKRKAAAAAADLSDKPSKRVKTQKPNPVQGYQDAVFSGETVELGRKIKDPRVGTGEAEAAAAAALKAVLNKNNKKGAKSESTADGSKKKKVKKEEEVKEEPAEVEVKSMPEFKEALKERMRAKQELDVFDNVKLGEEGWKDRYYNQKFHWGERHSEEKQTLLRIYTEGLQWVMKYYYVGCLSWGWYYPYHYAPFASDLVECDVSAKEIVLDMGKPFAPFSQLQAVMPASSGKLVLPKCYSDLMVDPKSPIIDYYPEDFELDLNGKRFAWQGVALLPFIDEKRLNDALAPLSGLLTEEEKERNSFGECCVIVHKDSPLGQWRSKKASADSDSKKRIPDDAADGQFFGKASYPLTVYGGNQGDIYTLSFEIPKYLPHSSELLPNAIPPSTALNDATLSESRRSGWKQAKFGPLGRAAKDLINDRERRLSGRGGRGGYSGHSGRGRGAQFGRHRGGYVANAPVINSPHNSAVNNMFGGLGQNPGWMAGQNSYSGPGHQGTNQASQYNQQPYGTHTDPYREPSRFGGYYGSGAQHQQPGWTTGGSTGWQNRTQSQSAQYGNDQRGWAGGSNFSSGGYQGNNNYPSNFNNNAGYGNGSQQYYGNQSVNYAARRRGRGLSGPTAESFRQSGRRGRGGGGGGGGSGGGGGGGGYQQQGGSGYNQRGGY